MNNWTPTIPTVLWLVPVALLAFIGLAWLVDIAACTAFIRRELRRKRRNDTFACHAAWSAALDELDTMNQIATNRRMRRVLNPVGLGADVGREAA